MAMACSRSSAAPSALRCHAHDVFAGARLRPNCWCMDSRRADHLIRCLSRGRSEEHTSELQSLMRISYAVFCLKKKKTNNHITRSTTPIQHTITKVHSLHTKP